MCTKSGDFYIFLEYCCLAKPRGTNDVVTGKLLISGACLRPDGYALGEGKYYDQAKLVVLDLETGEFRERLSKTDGGDNYPSRHPNLQFTAGALDGDVLWQPTDTEILQYQLPDLTLVQRISHPCFHNIHSVQVFDDQLAVTSTGLDNVVLVDKHTGNIDRILNTEGKDPWHRFDPEVDYRLVHSTRPHDSHPNFVFQLDGRMWVTRCTQEDAVCLEDVTQRIDITNSGNISVHDGLWWGENLVFTRVDGLLVLCDPGSKSVIETRDPFAAHRNRPRGWCRGLHIDGDLFYIGYSRLRKTHLKSKLKYLSQGNFRYGFGNSSLVVVYDMARDKVIQVHESPEGMIDAIYGILPWEYE